jgi:hypothetical protein
MLAFRLSTLWVVCYEAGDTLRPASASVAKDSGSFWIAAIVRDGSSLPSGHSNDTWWVLKSFSSR